MNKYIRFAVLGAFFIPCKSYWVILAIFMFICFASLVAVGHIHIGGYVEPEQVYAVTVGYITQNNRAMPKDVYIIENGKKRIIPRNNVTIRLCSRGTQTDVTFRIWHTKNIIRKGVIAMGRIIAICAINLVPMALWLMLGICARMGAVYYVLCGILSIADIVDTIAKSKQSVQYIRHHKEEFKW